MVDINELKDLEYLLKLRPDNKGLKDIFTKTVDSAIEKICLDHGKCPVCGKDTTLGTVDVINPHTSYSHRLTTIQVPVCSDENCDYTKLVNSRFVIERLK